MDIKEVYQLIEKFENSSLLELSLELENTKLAMKKGQAVSNNIDWKNIEIETKEEFVVNTVEKFVEDNAASVTEKVITAPLVGIFYRAPAPGEQPFVEVGQQVKKGDVVGIIEAMKLMNEITATEDGVVESVEVEDESLVEYGEVLIRLG